MTFSIRDLVAARFSIARTTGTVPVILNGDHFQDNDDLIATLAAVSKEFERHLTLVGVVVSLSPAKTRALATKGALIAVGHDLPVGIGTDMNEPHPNVKGDYAYMYRGELPAGSEVFSAALAEANAGELCIAGIAGMRDIAQTLLHNPKRLDRIGELVLMSGVRCDSTGALLDADGFMTPDNANNNTFDPFAAEFVYRRAQEAGIRTTVVTRAAAYSAKIPKSVYDAMAATGHPVGLDLGGAQRSSLIPLWKKANAPAGHPDRGTLPPDRDRKWFSTAFLGGVDPVGDDFWPHVVEFAMYDVMAITACAKAYVDRYFEPSITTVNGVDHRIIGVSNVKHGVKDPAGFRALVNDSVISTLRGN